jgi:hypothetical protein
MEARTERSSVDNTDVRCSVEEASGGAPLHAGLGAERKLVDPVCHLDCEGPSWRTPRVIRTVNAHRTYIEEGTSVDLRFNDGGKTDDVARTGRP